MSTSDPRHPLDVDKLVCDSILSAVSDGQISNAVDKILSGITSTLRQMRFDVDYVTIRSIVKSLDSRGFFEMRGAVAKVSNTFNVSRVTIYNAIKSENEIS